MWWRWLRTPGTWYVESLSLDSPVGNPQNLKEDSRSRVSHSPPSFAPLTGIFQLLSCAPPHLFLTLTCVPLAYPLLSLFPSKFPQSDHHNFVPIYTCPHLLPSYHNKVNHILLLSCPSSASSGLRSDHHGRVQYPGHERHHFYCLSHWLLAVSKARWRCHVVLRTHPCNTHSVIGNRNHPVIFRLPYQLLYPPIVADLF